MKIFYALFILLTLCSAVIAQRDAPVAGNAATLVDLLKKNYNSINEETRDDEIIRDRALVISIFKSYLKDDQLNSIFSSAIFNPLNLTLEASLKDYNTAKRNLASFQTVNFNVNGADYEAESIRLKIETLSDNLEDTKQQYYKAKFNVNNKELEVIKDKYDSENKFISHMVELFMNKYKSISNGGTDDFSSADFTSSIQKSIPFIGGDLAFETVIDGLSRFLAKRIKEELTTYVIEKVQLWLQNPKEDDPLAELKVLLPRTKDYLIGFQADKITSFPHEIKQYIEDDLNHILEHVGNLRTTPRLKKLINKNPDIDFALEALETIPNLSKIKNPIDYFKIIDNSRNLNRWQNDPDPEKSNIANIMKLSSMLVQSMTIVDNGEIRFAGTDFIGTYAAENHFYLLYLGFLYQQNVKFHHINFIVNSSFGKNLPNSSILPNSVLKLEEVLKSIVEIPFNTITTLKTDKDFFQLILSEISNNAEKVAVLASEIRKLNKAGVKIGADTVYNFVDAMVGLSENLSFASDTLFSYLLAKRLNITVNNSIILTPNYFTNKLKPYFLVARTTNNIFINLQRKKYATALLTALELVGKITPESELSNISSSINKIGMFRYNDNLKFWKTVIDSVSSTNNGQKSGKLKPAFITAAFFVYGEIKKIDQFNSSRYGTSISDLDNLKTFILNVVTTKIIDGADANFLSIVSYLKKDSFKRLLVSYYTNTELENLIKNVKIEMNKETYLSFNNILRNVFDANEQAHVQLLIEQFSDKLFENYITKGYKDEGADLLNHRQILNTTLKNLFSILPQKFNIANHPQVLSLVHFINDMAIAKDAADVEKAIESFALPSGSYSIKRTAAFNFSLNSYPGLLPAYEASWSNGSSKNAFSIGFTAPIGLSATAGTLHGYSWGIFVPIIDIGAVTRLRLDNNTTTGTLPKLNFKNFLSPGLFFHLGFKKSPLSINIGGQFGPEVQSLDNITGSVSTWESIRFGAGLVLDIPLFNIYTKPRFKE